MHEVNPNASPQLRALDRLVGRWTLSGGAAGTTTYAWMEGGHFLLQQVELGHDGERQVGMEVIGHLHPLMGERSADVHSRYYSAGGETLDYVYELEADTLTIWAGERDSPAFYRGTFSADDTTLSGRWTWPGGGYESTSTRA